MLLGREFQTFRAHDEKQRAPIAVCDGCSENRYWLVDPRVCDRL